MRSLPLPTVRSLVHPPRPYASQLVPTDHPHWGLGKGGPSRLLRLSCEEQPVLPPDSPPQAHGDPSELKCCRLLFYCITRKAFSNVMVSFVCLLGWAVAPSYCIKH